jgi:hypothetical protein
MATNPYAGFQWTPYDSADQSADFGNYAWKLEPALRRLGFTSPIYGDPRSLGQSPWGENMEMRDEWVRTASPELQQWLADNNYRIGSSYGLGGQVNNGTGTGYQGIIDAAGNAVDAESFSYNNGRSGFKNNPLAYIVPAFLAMVGGGAAMTAAGAGAGAAGLTGVDAAMADLVAAGGLTPASMGGIGADALLGGADIAGSGLLGGEGLAGTPWTSAAADSQLANLGGDAVWGSAGNGMTGATVASGVPSAVDLGSLGGVMSTGAAASAPGSLIPGTAASALPSWAAGLPSGVIEALKAAGIIAGAVAGSKTQPGDVTSTQNRMDPRMDPYVYGDQGILKAASDWYAANKSGSNDTMNQFRNKQLGLLNDPALAQQIAAMQQGAAGLLNSPIAGNPYANWVPKGR